MNTPNKIKFVDDDGSVEVLEPPMTARVHVETPTQEEVIPETIEEEPSSTSESVIIVSSSTESSVEDLKSSVEGGDILNLEAGEEVKGAETGEAVKEPLNEEVIEKVVEQHIKDLEKMESVILGSGIGSSIPSFGEPDIIKSDEVKVPEDQDMKSEQETKSGALGPEAEQEVIDKESLSLVANAVSDVRANERVPITPKGCCILQ
jgi:hypothetical protein